METIITINPAATKIEVKMEAKSGHLFNGQIQIRENTNGQKIMWEHTGISFGTSTTKTAIQEIVGFNGTNIQNKLICISFNSFSNDIENYSVEISIIVDGQVVFQKNKIGTLKHGHINILCEKQI